MSEGRREKTVSMQDEIAASVVVYVWRACVYVCVYVCVCVFQSLIFLICRTHLNLFDFHTLLSRTLNVHISLLRR